jgi:hypothetical protein
MTLFGWWYSGKVEHAPMAQSLGRRLEEGEEVVREYTEAMERKLEIARYHLAELQELLPHAQPDERGLPPIALQAHFEGCGRAVVAMVDQLASGVASVFPDMPPVYEATPQRVLAALKKSTHPSALKLQGTLADIEGDRRINDLRDVRNRSTHRFDEKKYIHGEGWFVVLASYLPNGIGRYTESRELSEYLQAMVNFGADALASAAKVQDLVTNP